MTQAKETLSEWWKHYEKDISNTKYERIGVKE